MTTQDPATPTDAPVVAPADAAAPSAEAARTALRTARGARARAEPVPAVHPDGAARRTAAPRR